MQRAMRTGSKGSNTRNRLERPDHVATEQWQGTDLAASNSSSFERGWIAKEKRAR